MQEIYECYFYAYCSGGSSGQDHQFKSQCAQIQESDNFLKSNQDRQWNGYPNDLVGQREDNGQFELCDEDEESFVELAECYDEDQERCSESGEINLDGSFLRSYDESGKNNVQKN